MYYEIKMTRLGIDEAGKEKKFTDIYLINALSILEAVTNFEKLIVDLYPEHSTVSVKQTGYSEVLADSAADYRFYKAKMNTIYIDERSGKDKKSPVNILIQANNIDSAKEKYEEMIKGWIVDIELESLSETRILDYFTAPLG